MNNDDLELLLKTYFGERRRLLFQLARVRDAISELKRRRALKPSKADAPKRGPGRPRKQPAADGAARPAGGKRKRTTKNGGYRLNAWDLMVQEVITRSGLMVREDLQPIALEWAKRHDPKRKAAAVDLKLTQTLQKLSGKRGVLGKYRSGQRRGYHYGLKEWFFNTTGEPRPPYRDQLSGKDDA